MDIELIEWCSPESDRRPSLATPWTVGEWTYATNGQGAIRVSSEIFAFPLGANLNRPNLESIENFWREGDVAFWMGLPVLERVEELMQCPECDGTGKGPEVRCHCCDEAHRCGDCDACGGAKARLQALPVVTGSGLLSWPNYERLRRLPDVEIGVLLQWSGFDDSWIPFRFTGGSGVVRGMTWVGFGRRRTEALAAVARERLRLLAPGIAGAGFSS